MMQCRKYDGKHLFCDFASLQILRTLAQGEPANKAVDE